MALNPNDISRLVHHYLSKEGFKASADTFANECSNLAHFCAVTRSDGTKELPRLIGPSLTEIIDEYFYVKDFIIDELRQLVCRSYFRSHDSLLTLFRTLLNSLKFPNSRELHENCQAQKSISESMSLPQHSVLTNIRCEAQTSSTPDPDMYIGPEEIGSNELDDYEEKYVPEVDNMCSLQECLEENCDSLPVQSPSHSSENFQGSSPENQEKPSSDHLFLVSMTKGFLFLSPDHDQTENCQNLPTQTEESSSNHNHDNLVEGPKDSSHRKNSTACSASRRKSKKNENEKERLIREIMLMAKVSSKDKSLRSDRRTKDSRRKTSDDVHSSSELNHSPHRKRRKNQNPTTTESKSDQHATDNQQTLENLSVHASEGSRQDAPVLETILRIKEESPLSEITPYVINSRTLVPSESMLDEANAASSAINFPEISPTSYQTPETCHLPCTIQVKQENGDDFESCPAQEPSQPVVLLSNVLRNLPILH